MKSKQQVYKVRHPLLLSYVPILFVQLVLLSMLVVPSSKATNSESENVRKYLEAAEKKAIRYVLSFERIGSSYKTDISEASKDLSTAFRFIGDDGLNKEIQALMIAAQFLIHNLNVHFMAHTFEGSNAACFGISYNLSKLKEVANFIELETVKVKHPQTAAEGMSAKTFLFDLVEFMRTQVPEGCMSIKEVDSILQEVKDQ